MPLTKETHTIRRALAGDQHAFRILCDAYSSQVYAIAARRSGNWDDLEDVEQVVFMRAFRALQTFRGESAFSTWLTRIALNVCYSRPDPWPVLRPWSDAVVLREARPLVYAENPEEALYRRECRTLVRQGIRELPGQCRHAMWLRYVKDYTYAEIGEELRVPVGTVKTWLFRGRKLLRGSFRDIHLN